MSKQVLSVTRLVHYLKMKLESDPLTQRVMVEGEISNFSNYRSGHWYFSLKDENSVIRCAMFATHNRKVSFRPKDGDKVIVQGDISVFEARGDMQLLVTGMRNSSIGELYLQFEQLKQKLNEEGLFSIDHKKPLPKYPFSIGLITGANTAARADVLSTLQERWPVCRIHEYPVLVQGKESASQIQEALLKADTKGHDVLLLVRGGGSIEDLWSFNDEALARVIYALNTPIVTGVGHEINFTIADFVADMRAPTPTGAAVLSTPDIREVRKLIEDTGTRLVSSMDNILENSREELSSLQNSRVFTMPERLYTEKTLRLNHIASEFTALMNRKLYNTNLTLQNRSNRLAQAVSEKVVNTRVHLAQTEGKLDFAVQRAEDNSRHKLSQTAQLLDALSPLKILSRGYAVVNTDKEPLRTVSQVTVGDSVEIRLADGRLDAEIRKIHLEDK